MSDDLVCWLPQSSVRPKMLIVDDQPANIRILHELFREDFDLYMASNGEQAIAQCEHLIPDLVLLDIMMPGLNGFEVCHRIKSDPLLTDIRVIFITAHYDENEEVRGFEKGAADFIHKPINPVVTRARVRNQLLFKQQTDLLRLSALTDGLTGIANRRKFETSLEVAWLQCARDRLPLSLIMADVDCFKGYNDTYGHQAGDDSLRQIAQSLRISLNRPYDLVARYGGEEFVCILPRTDLRGATHLAQALVDGVRGMEIEHRRSQVGQVVTLSAGLVTCLPQDQLRIDDLVAAADTQLYRAKDAGRDRVSAAELDAQGAPLS